MNGKVQRMGGNKDNMRQAMKELLGLVGFGPEETETQEKPVEAQAAARPEVQERPVVREKTVAAERPIVREEPKAAPEQPKTQTPPAAAAKPVVERPVQQPRIEREPTVERKEPVRSAASVEMEMEETRQKVASTVERSFFPFGRPKAKEPSFEETFTAPKEENFFAREFETVEEDTIRPPFIRPGATVIAAGATFFGDIRAEGDVEVLGKVKGNLEATGNVRVLGKVLGDVKGEAVILEGCTVQGNVTSTSYVSLDAGAMVVGDVLATDFQSDGKVKGNLQIARAATFSACALLAGNVIAATIMMSQGAKIQGAVRIAEDPETNALFGDLEI
jgi:cytoskeletal protein CcmA (bactofilin family)